jgi:hypothetical protein
MKNSITASVIVKKIPSILLSLTLLLMMGSCARKISFQNSEIAPAAEGTVKVKKDGNSNYEIKIDLTNLAHSERLTPAKNVYVVWMETDQNMTRNIGQINSSKNFMSNKLKASFETVSSFKPVKIFITAEDEASISSPGNTIVMTTRNF